MTISDYVISEFNQHAFETANSLGGLDTNPLYPPTTNDQYDAYRHALMSAELTRFGENFSKKMMDDHENSSPNTPPINNMDRWNNNVGREEYKKWRDAKEAGQTTSSPACATSNSTLSVPTWCQALGYTAGAATGISGLGKQMHASPHTRSNSISKSKMNYYSLSRRAGEGWGEGGNSAN